MATRRFEDVAILWRHIANPRTKPADDVIHQPRRGAVGAQPLSGRTVNQRAFVKVGQGFRADEAAVAQILDFGSRRFQSRAPFSPAHRDRAWVLAVIVPRKPIINVVQIGESQPDEPRHLFVLKNLGGEEPKCGLQEPTPVAV